MKHPLVVRDVEGEDMLEMLIVFAVVTVLAIRAFLKLTGYPQLGVGGLHIAHILWGGFFMLLALALLLLFWNPGARRLAAALGGIGFGFFIDELGKFITKDNDYFFQPTVAVQYVLFLGLFGAVRFLRASLPPDPRTEKLNREVRSLLATDGPTRSPLLHFFFRARTLLAVSYRRLASRPAFGYAVTAWFVLLALVNLAYAIAAYLLWREHSLDVPIVQGLSALASAVCVWIGAVRLPRSRLAAFEWFRRGVAATILFGQVVAFYHVQFAALWGLAFNVLLYLALGY
ncbi:MAG: hypothetical protein ACREOU_15020, partial [Candidatus Eiseniibacteriota bacterium]